MLHALTQPIKICGGVAWSVSELSKMDSFDPILSRPQEERRKKEGRKEGRKVKVPTCSLYSNAAQLII